MKNCPPCCGLWLPCGRRLYTAFIGVPSRHTPGLIDAVDTPGHVQLTAIVMRSSGVPSTGHLPGVSCTTRPGFDPHVNTDTRRMGTSVMPHFGHLPGLSSMMSSSPIIVQTYESGGRSCFFCANG